MGEAPVELGFQLPLSKVDRAIVAQRLAAAGLDLESGDLDQLINAVQRALLLVPEEVARASNMGLSERDDADLERRIAAISSALQNLRIAARDLGRLLPDVDSGLTLGWSRDFDALEIAVLRAGFIDPNRGATFLIASVVRLVASLRTEPTRNENLDPAEFFKVSPERYLPERGAVNAIMSFRKRRGLTVTINWYYGDRAKVKHARRTDDELQPITPADRTVSEVFRAFGLRTSNRKLRNYMVSWRQTQRVVDAFEKSQAGRPLLATSLVPKRRKSKKERLG